VPDGSAYTVFTTGYQSRFDADVTNQSFTAQSYDAAWMVIYGMAYAISQRGGVSGRAIASGFRQLADTSVMETDVIPSRLQGIVNSLSMGSTVNIRGASSALDYDLSIEEITGAGAVELWCVSDASGSFEISATCPATPAP
jgi:branched-chain amino acid transport system substrate-binding protein